MIAKRYAREDSIAFDGTDNILGSGFGLEDREDRAHTLEHARADKVRCDGGDMYISFALL